jgi:hypothetical protein
VNITDIEHRMYYRAALAGLRHVEAQRPSGRRFCEQADARWSGLQGSLKTADRIDLLLRDANAQWPSAFGARAVFDLRAVAEDEPFGADWSSLDPVDAEEIWRKVRATPAPGTLAHTLDAVFTAWEARRRQFPVEPVAPNEKLAVAGASAIAALIEAFAAGKDLDWADQVLCVATDPLARQLAALGAALLNSTRATQLAATADAKQLAGRRMLVSDDATEQDAAALRAAEH